MLFCMRQYCLIAVMIVSLWGISSCSEKEEFGNALQKPQMLNLVGESYTWSNHKQSITLKFRTSSTCDIHNRGFEYVGAGKDYYDYNKSCSYTISGNTVTLKSWPFYVGDDDYDVVLTYYSDDGGYLWRRGEFYYKD